MLPTKKEGAKDALSPFFFFYFRKSFKSRVAPSGDSSSLGLPGFLASQPFKSLFYVEVFCPEG